MQGHIYMIHPDRICGESILYLSNLGKLLNRRRSIVLCNVWEFAQFSKLWIAAKQHYLFLLPIAKAKANSNSTVLFELWPHGLPTRTRRRSNVEPKPRLKGNETPSRPEPLQLQLLQQLRPRNSLWTRPNNRQTTTTTTAMTTNTNLRMENRMTTRFRWHLFEHLPSVHWCIWAFAIWRLRILSSWHLPFEHLTFWAFVHALEIRGHMCHVHSFSLRRLSCILGFAAQSKDSFQSARTFFFLHWPP